MLNKRVIFSAAALLTATLLTACGGSKGINNDDAASANNGANTSNGSLNNDNGYANANLGANTTIGGAEPGLPPFTIDPLDDPASPLSKRTIYFAYDSSEVTAESTQVLRAHAQYLGDHPTRRVVLVGHADENGTREYNLGLGLRRATAVHRLMLLYGVAPQQIKYLSFGEEKPVAFGHNESAWAQNRRVEIEYN